jgi:hypothetical protein
MEWPLKPSEGALIRFVGIPQAASKAFGSPPGP